MQLNNMTRQQVQQFVQQTAQAGLLIGAQVENYRQSVGKDMREQQLIAYIVSHAMSLGYSLGYHHGKRQYVYKDEK